MRQISYDIIQWFIVVPVTLPLFFSALCLMLSSKYRMNTMLCYVALVIQIIFSAALFQHVLSHGIISMTMGEWLPPFGITFNVDLFSALLSFVTNCVALITFSYASEEITAKKREFGFQSLFLLLVAGANGGFLTGDIFNLYVWFELVLIASFGLLTYGGNKKQFDGGIKYSVLNLLATTFFLITVIFLYSATGTLNMADLSRLAQEGFDFGSIGYILIFSMGMKAALFPLFFWLPASYHVSYNAVSALFGGVLTKIGAYTLYRMYTSVLVHDANQRRVLLLLGIVTIISSSVMLLAERQLKRQLGFLVIIGIGMLMLALGLGSVTALAAGVFYFVHSMLVVSVLYLLMGLFANGELFIDRNCGYYKRQPLLSSLVLICFFIVAGLPPFSGFWPKIMLIQESLKSAHLFALASIIITSFLVLLGLARSYALVFWQEGESQIEEDKTSVFSIRLICVMVLFSILIVIGVQPEYLGEISFNIANALMQPTDYVKSVFDDVY